VPKLRLSTLALYKHQRQPDIQDIARPRRVSWCRFSEAVLKRARVLQSNLTRKTVRPSIGNSNGQLFVRYQKPAGSIVSDHAARYGYFALELSCELLVQVTVMVYMRIRTYHSL
jgi:hypothetical protein